eukprot:scaffold84278_cov35-Tisochrysis_lutea.AAC.8
MLGTHSAGKHLAICLLARQFLIGTTATVAIDPTAINTFIHTLLGFTKRSIECGRTIGAPHA